MITESTHMKLSKLKNNRLVIYFFYDRDGIVDDYIIYMLNEIKSHVRDILFVCNGHLEESSIKRVDSITSNILIRENKGFDVWAYKEGLLKYGWEKLSEYDEVILMNHTIMGPIHPFSEMFDQMDALDIDFWGITTYHKIDFDPFGKCQYGYIPLHIQSHFISVRQSMLKSAEFKNYWDERPMINNYAEAICWHEAIFTKTFEDKGFKWKAYVDTTDMVKNNYYPLMMSPLRLIRDKRCPIFKRRSFFHSYDELLTLSNGNQAMDLLEYLKNKTGYNTDMIWANILRLENMADIKKCLHLNYILPSKIELDTLTKRKIALIIHIYFEDLIKYCFNYACSMPDYSDIYITTNTLEKKQLIEKVFSMGKWNNVEVILIENRGRDVSALLVAAKSFIMDYDYVCFMHDKKVGQLNYEIKGESFSYQCFESNLKNNAYVNHIINLFEENPRLGLLTPPPPSHADYYPTISFEWGYNYDNVKQLADKLGLNVSIDPLKEPIAPLGTMFWFRSKAMKQLFDLNWEYSDFPPEPNGTDGTLLHAIERIYPYVVQNEGYYPAWCMPDTFARVETTNLYHMLSEVNRVAFQLYGFNYHYGLVCTMKYALNQHNEMGKNETDILLKRLLKEKIKTILPKPIWSFIKKIYYLLKRIRKALANSDRR